MGENFSSNSTNGLVSFIFRRSPGKHCWAGAMTCLFLMTFRNFSMAVCRELNVSWGRCFVILLLPFVACGCGPQTVSSVPVQGFVTLDGKPVADGAIYFISPGKVPEFLPIENGRFSGQVKPGRKRIEIAALRSAQLSPDKKNGPPLPIETKENYLPARYHSQSTLIATIVEAENPELKFTLTSNP